MPHQSQACDLAVSSNGRDLGCGLRLFHGLRAGAGRQRRGLQEYPLPVVLHADDPYAVFGGAIQAFVEGLAAKLRS